MYHKLTVSEESFRNIQSKKFIVPLKSMSWRLVSFMILVVNKSILGYFFPSTNWYILVHLNKGQLALTGWEFYGREEREEKQKGRKGGRLRKRTPQ